MIKIKVEGKIVYVFRQENRVDPYRDSSGAVWATARNRDNVNNKFILANPEDNKSVVIKYN